MTSNAPQLASPRVAIIASAGGLAIIAFGVFVDVELAVLLLGAFAIAGALARLRGPTGGSFVVRSRAVDVAMLGFLGSTLLLLGTLLIRS